MKQIIEEGLPDSNPSAPPASLTRKVTIINEWLKLIAVLSFSFVCVSLGIFILHANKTLAKADATLDNVNTTISSVNKEVAQAEITRKSLDDLMVQATTLITDADTAASNEITFLASMNTQLTSTIGDVNTFVSQATTDEHDIATHSVQTIDATTTSVAAIKPALDQVKIDLVTSNDDLAAIQKRITDPAITQIVENTKQITASSVDTAASVKSITKDGADEIHSLVHPTKKTGFKASLGAVITYLAHLAPPFF